MAQQGDAAACTALADEEALASMAHLLQKSTHRIPPPSFALLPATPLPLWQRIVTSALQRAQFDDEEEKQARTTRNKLSKELRKYIADSHAREELQRRQQREARAQLGKRLAIAGRRFWARRRESYQQVARVEFDVLKRQRDKRKQEDLLRETEELTKKLVNSLFSGKPKDVTDEKADGGVQSGSTGTASSSLPPLQSSTRHADSTASRGELDAVDIESSLSLLDTEDGKRPLRHYQRSALHWMIHLFENKLNGILADEMGLGKTVQTIALLCYFAEYKNDWGPHLIVVPTTVVLNWKAELQRWAPGLKVLTYIGSQKERQKLRQGWTREDAFHVCVTSYNLVVQDRRVFRNRAWGFLVLDEAHQVKNFMSKKWQSLFDLQAEYRLLLTGTPLQNSVMELWSLFHFLLPFASAFRSNDEFKEWFSNPMDDMVTGQSNLNEEIVRRLQALIRPFMLRRLKKDVESQLPSKMEKVVMCRLSRRQRSLYDDYMQLAETKQRLRGGGAGGVLGVLLGLRKVCDHPDLFEERPTVTPFALDRCAVVELSVPRCVLLRDNVFAGRYRFRRLPTLEVVDVNEDGKGTDAGGRRCEDDVWHDWLPCSLLRLNFAFELPSLGSADATKDALCQHFAQRMSPDHFPENRRLGQLQDSLRLSAASIGVADAERLIWEELLSSTETMSASVERTACIQQRRHMDARCTVFYPVPKAAAFRRDLKECILQRQYPGLCPSIAERAQAMMPLAQRVAVYVPAAVAVFPPCLHWYWPVRRPQAFLSPTRETLAELVGFVARKLEAAIGDRQWRNYCFDGSSFLSELWPIHVRRCFSFPDKQLLVHDCGKLQFLSTALKQLRREGHRVLVFTQFVQMLTVLERFLALIGFTYLRLDGATRAEVRQAMVDRFNEDEKVSCMILSTRSGGIGLNLTGADTVIFYDSDWNPTMDLQAQDRCHRIGQTRPVTIYRLISEHTVEEAILEKARERKKLNNIVIRGGQFHTIAGVEEEYDDSAAALAALSDPVNLRSFFHDYDEDVTLSTDHATSGTSASSGAQAAAAMDIAAEMANVEDAEDREARVLVEQEMHQRAAEEAAELDGDGDVSHTLRDGADTGELEGCGPRTVDTGTVLLQSARHTSRAEALRAQNTLLQSILAGQGVRATALGSLPTPVPVSDDEEEDQHAELLEGNLMPVVRKRQREAVEKCRSPLDQLLTARFAVCHEVDAWNRYERLCDSYASRLTDEERSRGVHRTEDATFPPFHQHFRL